MNETCLLGFRRDVVVCYLLPSCWLALLMIYESKKEMGTPFDDSQSSFLLLDGNAASSREPLGYTIGGRRTNQPTRS
jgi:hypothetical protein